MVQIDIQTLIDLLKDSIGIEAAEKTIYKAIEDAHLSAKTFYSIEEFGEICEMLKKKGGYIKTIGTIATAAAHKNIYFQKELIKERKEKEDLARLKDTLEQKVEERTKQLKEANAQLLQSAKMAAVGQLGAGVAHELNNPLGGILGYIQYILEKFEKPNFSIDDFKSCKKYIEDIEKESIRCKKIVENLLKFSRKAGSIDINPIEINKVIEDTLCIIDHLLKMKNIKVFIDIQPDLIKIKGISNLLQQVFTNIILNAQQSINGSGEVKIKAANIVDKESDKIQGVSIEISDTGCGIKEENRSKIFEPFFTTKEALGGTGLGLSVCYQIIEEHKGSIEFKSEVGKGTTFIITLPPGI
ncbi:hypothetical protein HY745_09345 [Candidatus Desantisbacteria bacterium]|nr:hypothetical protein [Candidatus Desantisbacteria bacterium]